MLMYLGRILLLAAMSYVLMYVPCRSPANAGEDAFSAEQKPIPQSKKQATIFIGNDGCDQGKRKLSQGNVNDESDQYLRRLYTADSFEGSFVYGGVSENYRAYRHLFGANGPMLYRIGDVLKNGSPAGKLYAAMLFHQFDPEVGRLVLSDLNYDKSPVEYNYRGCWSDTSTVGAVARELLNSPDIRKTCFEVDCETQPEKVSKIEE